MAVSTYNSAAEASVKNRNSKEAGIIHQSQTTAQMSLNGNILNTQVPGLNEYPHYLQNIMDRNEWVKEANSGLSNSEILTQRLKSYKDWRAKLSISPLTNINYAERNYHMFGRGGARTLESSATTQNAQSDTRMGFLRVLTEVGGILFPYTPVINVMGNANYQVQKLTHSNITYNTWENSDPESYDITGKFTASNPSEALYCLAIMNFLRVITKGSGPNYDGSEGRYAEDVSLQRYGDTSMAGMGRELPGAPPPILYFTAYGHGMIDEVPVSVQSYSYQLQDDIDYVELILDPNTWTPVLDQTTRRNNEDIYNYVIARVPTKFNLSLKLITNINPTKYKSFSLWDYKNGEYIKPYSSIYGFNTGWTF